MPTEIERKFLTRDDSWRDGHILKKVRYRQGYLGSSPASSVRIRISDHDAFLNIKGVTIGASRAEYEYPIPENEAAELLEHLCDKPLIEKTRYYLEYQGHTWEIDVFEGDNDGLVVAEVELGSEDESFAMPPWAGKEVTEDARYYNSCLARSPFKDWGR